MLITLNESIQYKLFTEHAITQDYSFIETIFLHSMLPHLLKKPIYISKHLTAKTCTCLNLYNLILQHKTIVH